MDIKIELIEEDKEFWREIENKLKMFYFDCLLPELIDSRLDRQMEIKEPDYIMQAVNKRNEIKIIKRKTENQQLSGKRRKSQ